MTAQILQFPDRKPVGEPSAEIQPKIDVYDVSANALGAMSLSLTEDCVAVCSESTQADLAVIHQMIMGLVERRQGLTTSNTKMLDYISRLRSIAFN